MTRSRKQAGPGRPRLPVLKLTEPEVVPMTEQQRKQAVSAMSTLILSWLQRRQLERADHCTPIRMDTDTDADRTSPDRHADHGEHERPAAGIDAGVRTL
jgi:hypothetical protein